MLNGCSLVPWLFAVWVVVTLVLGVPSTWSRLYSVAVSSDDMRLDSLMSLAGEPLREPRILREGKLSSDDAPLTRYRTLVPLQGANAAVITTTK
jgi:hypothetical protein